MFHFDSPLFALLLPLPYLMRKYLPFSKEAKNQSAEIYFPALDHLKRSFPSYTPAKRTSKRTFLFFLMLAWVLLILALMQPERIDQVHQMKNKGYDLMLAVDISGSMQAVDFSTRAKIMSRLDVTKEVVGNFVKNRHGDRVGLITFGEHAYLHVPLTLDTLAVSTMLNDTTSGMAGNSTAIGDAIGLSVKTLRSRPEGSRVLILLTDGEDNASSIPPLEAAKLAKQYGIRIYTIGIGKNGPVPFPTKLGGYGLAEVPIDEDLLKEIAHITNGKFFRATDQRALESIYSQIDKLEKTEANESIYFIREPYYFYPLALSMLIIFLLSMSQLLFRRPVHGA